MSSLVIVESPAKARTINKILGNQYAVKASVGHIMDLPSKVMGIDVEKDFAPEYVAIPGKEKIIRELKAAAKKADKIYLAPDPDREGEAIAYHIASIISEGKGKDLEDRVFRVTFNEITAKAVKEAMKAPVRVDMDKVDAQQARRVLDRLVGYGLSPLLWRKVRKGLSAGRVQSVAVRIIVDREREIEAFNKEEYWSVVVRLNKKGGKPPEFEARLHRLGDALVISRDAGPGKQFLLKDAREAQKAVEAVRAGDFSVEAVTKKTKKRSPQPPFTTSTLQQEASRKLRFSAKKTMLHAQQLYEGVELGPEGAHGLITYMRTDSVRLAAEAQAWAREAIAETYGKDYMPPKPPKYKSKASAQEAHEAVRPTSSLRPPEAVKKFLSRDQLNLYTLIWNRFMASQMSSAVLEQTTCDIACKAGLLRASGSVIKFNGFMAVYTEGRDDAPDDEEGLLPAMKKGDKLASIDVSPVQHFTQPPPRFTEATLVRALEEKGVGRPSTYAAILSTVVDRKYVQKDSGKFSPTELGIVVNDLLVEKFPGLLDIGFTAKMEDSLDRVENGKIKWVKVVGDFYKPFSHDLEEATKAPGKVELKDDHTDEVCEKCSAPMQVKWGRHGKFLACTGYPDCKNAKPLGGAEQEKQEEPTGEECPKCGAPMVRKAGRFGKFLACSKYPECKTTKPISTGVKCPLDGGDVVERRSKKGKLFWSCGNYPKCKYASWYKPVSVKCPDCGEPLLFEKRDKASGGMVHFCAKKECGYKKELQEEGGDG